MVDDILGSSTPSGDVTPLHDSHALQTPSPGDYPSALRVPPTPTTDIVLSSSIIGNF